MQVFVNYQGRSTTVSVGEELMQLLGTKLRIKVASADQSTQMLFAKHAVRAFVTHAPEQLDAGLSQYVQQGIVHAIAAPELIALLPRRSCASGLIDFPALTDQAVMDFIGELIEKKKRFERDIAELTRERVRRPRRKFGMVVR